MTEENATPEEVTPLPPETPVEPEAPRPTNAAFLLSLIEKASPAEPVDPDAAKPAEIARASALAQDGKLGEKFSIGGRTFTRQYLSIDTEFALIEIIRSVLVSTGQGNLLAGFMAELHQAKTAVALILCDQDPECTTDWLSTRPRDIADAVTVNRLVGIISAQLSLNETAGFLVEVSGVAAQLGRLLGGKVPG